MFSQPVRWSGPLYTTARCAIGTDDWRVEAIDYENEGIVYVTCFSGPDAEERAEEYAAWKNNQRRPE